VTDQAGAVTALTHDADAESEARIRQIIERATGTERPKP